MKLHVLMRTYVVLYRDYTEVLGVYDDDHIKEAADLVKKRYHLHEIWVEDIDLNSMDIFMGGKQ